MYSTFAMQGVFSATDYGQQGFRGSTNIGIARDLRFNASGSNSIYTDNGKVYPASIALNFIIKT